MKPTRTTYLIIAVLLIPTGLYLRHRTDWFPDVINLYLGDVLYATLFFYLLSIAFPKKSALWRALWALACYVIELLQLYKAPWIEVIRNNKLGGLILGHEFLWSDLLAYFIGVSLGYVADVLWRMPRQKQ